MATSWGSPMTDSASARTTAPPRSAYRFKLRIRAPTGSLSRPIGWQGGVDLDVFTTSGAIINGTSQMSLTDPASHPMAFVVGAVDVDGYLTNPAEPFSEQGTRAIQAR